MFNKDTLTGQMMIFILPVPLNIILGNGGDNVMSYIASIVRLIIPLIIFCYLFGTQKKGKGADFRFIRFCIASILWYLGWVFQRYILFEGFSSIAFELSHTMNISFSMLDAAINATYDVIVLSLIVVLSCEIGKWMKDISSKLQNYT